MTSLTRRRAIALGATSGVAVLAGCLETLEHATDGSLEDDEEDEPTGSGELGSPSDHVVVTVTDMPNPSFEPPVVHVKPGGTVRWLVEGRYHTVTAYHPETYGPLRCPEGVDPFDSGLLRADREFEWRFEEEGVYDYADTRALCATHEALGAVGRVVVGWPDPDGQPALEHDVTELQGRATTVMREIDEETRSVLEQRRTRD